MMNPVTTPTMVARVRELVLRQPKHDLAFFISAASLQPNVGNVGMMLACVLSALFISVRSLHSSSLGGYNLCLKWNQPNDLEGECTSVFKYFVILDVNPNSLKLFWDT